MFVSRNGITVVWEGGTNETVECCECAFICCMGKVRPCKGNMVNIWLSFTLMCLGD